MPGWENNFCMYRQKEKAGISESDAEKKLQKTKPRRSRPPFSDYLMYKRFLWISFSTWPELSFQFTQNGN